MRVDPGGVGDHLFQLGAGLNVCQGGDHGHLGGVQVDGVEQVFDGQHRQSRFHKADMRVRSW